MAQGQAPFHFKSGSFFCEEIDVENLFDNLPKQAIQSVLLNGQPIEIDVPATPVFLHSSAALKRNVEKYQEALTTSKINCSLGYALKANGNQFILKALKSYGVEMLVTVSGNEILAGIQAGFDPNCIILNGNGKQEWEIKLAMQLGTILNVDSKFDCNRITHVKRRLFPEKNVKVLLRIRPSFLVHKQGSTVHPYVNTAEESKFGFELAELDDILKVLEEDPQIQVYGIHCHLGSCIYDPEVYRCMGEMMVDITTELEKKGHPVKLLDIGGGIGIDYHKHIPGVEEFIDKGRMSREYQNPEGIPDHGTFMGVISDVIPKNMQIILEPGRSLVANTCAIICKVLGVKTAGKKRFVVVDASMAEIIRPCLYNSFHQIYPTTLVKDGSWLQYEVVGPICETADFLGHDILLQQEPNSYLAVMDAGAYCSSMSSNYNMRPRPAEILVDGASWKYIKERETFAELMMTTNKVKAGSGNE